MRFGGGIPIVAACDLAIAAEEAVFGISKINFGSIPAGPVAKSSGSACARVMRCITS